MKNFWQTEKRLMTGDWHAHTSYTDGRSSVNDYCREAVSRGLKLLTFTEHVRREMSYNYSDFVADIIQGRQEFDIELLVGCEAKVLDTVGSLDVSEDVLKQCDAVTAVFHSFLKVDKQSYLKALKAMLGNPKVDIWGHPLLFARRNNINLEKAEKEFIINLCVENRVLIERNLKYQLPEIDFIRLAAEKSARFVIGSDAHSAEELPTSEKLEQEWRYIAGDEK